MAQNSSTHSETQTEQHSKPDLALKRLEKLVGTWEIRGRTLDSDVDTIFGQVMIDWTMGGFFLELRGQMGDESFHVQSLEILGYDPATDTFPAMVYSNLEGKPTAYYWNVQGNVVTHWTQGSKYTGTFSDDGNTLSGGWRADPGVEQNAGNTYDAVMIRVK